MNCYNAFYFFVIIGTSAVESFTWVGCGDSTDPVKITSLSGNVNSNKILSLTGTGKVALNLTSPIEAQLQVRKKFFWGWTILPCYEDFGSCTYPDICSMSPYLNQQCPAEFNNNNLPCNCPILQGQYAAKKLPIDLNFLPVWVERGTYKIKIDLFKDKQRLTCVILTETL